MIQFHDWVLSTQDKNIGYQYDHNTRVLIITGDLPEGWTWDLMVEVRGHYDILPLEKLSEGWGVKLTRDQLCIGGYYYIQLRGTWGDQVRQTNQLQLYINDSIFGEAHWPVFPSELVALERQVYEDAARSETASTKATVAAAEAKASAEGVRDVSEQVAQIHQNVTASQAAQDKAQAAAQKAVEAQAATNKDALATAADRQVVTAGRADAQEAAHNATQQATRAKDEADKAAGAVEAGLGGVRANIRVLFDKKADKEDIYELIETITMTESGTMLRTEEPDGTPYQFKSVFVRIAGGDGVLNTTIGFKSKGSWVGQFPLENCELDKKYASCRCNADHGYWRVTGTSPADNAYISVNSWESGAFYNNFREINYYDSINTVELTIPLPANSIIEIWGVRGKW